MFSQTAAAFTVAFIALFGAHHLADYPLQTDHQAQHKADRDTRGWLANQAHASIHTAVTALLLAMAAAVLHLPLTVAGTAAALAWIHISHSAIDRRRGVAWWMAHARQSGFAQHGGAAHVDQTAHLVLGLIPAAAALATL